MESMTTFILWWCRLFGVQDPQTLRIVLAVVIAGLLLGLIAITLKVLRAAFVKVFTLY